MLHLMECNIFFQQTRWPPLFYANHFMPQSYSIFFPNKLHHPVLHQPSLLSCPLRVSIYSASLKTIDCKKASSKSLYIHIQAPDIKISNGFKKSPANKISTGLELTVDECSKNPSLPRINDVYPVQSGYLDSTEWLKWYSGVLRCCADNLWFDEGRAVHGEMIKRGIVPDEHLWVSLINFYAKCGAVNLACIAFDEMPEKDVVSWTALISGFVAQGHGREGVELVCEMMRSGVMPNGFTLAAVLKCCSMCFDPEFGEQLHTVVVKVGALSDVYVGSALVDLYAKCGDKDYAHKVFDAMTEQNAVSWNALLNGYAQAGEGDEVLRLFCKMTESGMRFSNYTLSSVLKGCSSLRNFRIGQVIHSMALKIGSEADDYISCSLVDMYSKCESPDDALNVFKSIRNPDVVTWSSMISGLEQHGMKLEATNLFHSMRLSGLTPNPFTLSPIVISAPDLGDLRYCKSIHGCVYKYGYGSEMLIANALISMYMNIGSVDDGQQVFSAMGEKDIVSWNSLLSGFHEHETSNQGPIIFRLLLIEGLEPNKYTFVSILRSCSSLLNVNFGKQVHAHIIKGHLDTDENIGTSLIDMYAKCRCQKDVELIFNRLKERDIFTWTVLISGYAQTSEEGEEAIRCFKKMQREGFKVNEFTLASCLKACSRMASLQNGQQLHSCLIKSGWCYDDYVASAVVDMYGKCGCIKDAEIVFKSLNSVDTVMWNTIICGYSQHGQSEQALQSFRTMLSNDVLPDEVTFIGVLSACSHMGLIEEGKKNFLSMSDLYEITPSIDHYACMVDLLGRAGRFDELESFIEHMKVPANALIWETLLGACKIHGNVELGERTAQKLFEIVPERDSNYIMLSNVYAAEGRWDDVARIRGLMNSRNVKKEPGCSWVEVNAQTHVFLSQDNSHPQALEIHQKSEELHEKVSAEGYIPNTSYVLWDVPDKKKKQSLVLHSERLALAFALINDNPSGTVRIFKNLRICGDCHEYMKCVSRMFDQKIVIRDINRFHHFHNGMCSCKDYW